MHAQISCLWQPNCGSFPKFLSFQCGFGTNSNNNDHIKCYEEVATAMDKEVSELLSEDIEVP